MEFDKVKQEPEVEFLLFLQNYGKDLQIKPVKTEPKDSKNTEKCKICEKILSKSFTFT
jgi:hypothetical protein